LAAAFGVHFGSTSASLAVCKDGKADVVANTAGDRVTPAIVAFTDHDIVVGLPAKQGLIRNATNTVCNVKRLIGRSFHDKETNEAIKESRVKIVDKNGSPMCEVEYKEKTTLISPEEIAKNIYKNMLQFAQHHVGSSESHDAVITVPLSFEESQVQAIRNSAEKAGFTILRVIPDATAAVLAYDVGQNNHNQACNVLVYRLGGISLDVSVIHCTGGLYRVLSNITSHEVSGKHFTDMLVQHFAGEFKRQWKADCNENKRSVAKLRNASETCKHIMSTLQTGQSSVDSLYEGIDFQCAISRSRFEGMCSSLVQKCFLPVDKALTEAGLTKDQIEKVIMCGGSSKLPGVQCQMKSYFSSAELLNSIPPDEVIAIGAAKQAGLLSGAEPEEMKANEKDTQVPCIGADILLESFAEGDAQYIPVIQKFSPVPLKRQKSVQLGEEQTSFCLHILAKTADKPLSLAKIVMKDLAGGSQINTIFHVKSDGSMHVTCSEPSSGQSQDVTIDCS
jgi:molecular chaperone DnaK (HSP70)